MELKRDEIVKALECCIDTKWRCEDCPYFNKGEDSMEVLMTDALSLINELTEENDKLASALAEYDYKTTLRISEEYVTADAYEELREENEKLKKRLKATNYMITPDGRIEMIPTVESVKSDTVREMRKEIEARCIKGGIYPAFVRSTIEQIAREMIGGENGNKED